MILEPWTFGSTVIDEAPKDYVGFVYLLTNQATGKKYIGKKLFWTTKKMPPLKGKTKKRHKKVETDWREYVSSSDEVQLLAEGGTPFKREILCFCKTKGELSYMELKEQVKRDALLLHDEYYNSIIQCRIHRKHVSGL